MDTTSISEGSSATEQLYLKDCIGTESVLALFSQTSLDTQGRQDTGLKLIRAAVVIVFETVSGSALPKVDLRERKR